VLLLLLLVMVVVVLFLLNVCAHLMTQLLIGHSHEHCGVYVRSNKYNIEEN